MATKYRRRDTEVQQPGRFARVPGVGQLQRATDSEGRIRRFYRDIRSELRKVVWPTREQATNLTVVVCIVAAAVGVFLGGVDLAFGELFKVLLGRV